MLKNFTPLILILCFLNCTSFYGQQKNAIDSLGKETVRNHHDTILALTYYRLAKEYERENNDSAIHYYRKSISRAQKAGHEYLKLISEKELGFFYTDINELDSGIYYLSKVLPFFEKVKDVRLLDITHYLGNSYFFKADYNKALEYYFKQLNTAQATENPVNIARAYINIGIIFKEQRKIDMSLDYLKKAFKGLTEKDAEVLYSLFANIGNIYQIKSKLENNTALADSAILNYKKAKEMCFTFGDTITGIVILSNIGNTYADMREFNKAIAEYNEAISLIKLTGYFEQVGRIYNNFATVYLDIKDTKNALIYLELAKEAITRSGSIDDLMENYNGYAKYYELVNDYKNAYKYHVLFKQYSDSLFSTENAEKRKELEMNFDFDKKNAALLAEQEKKDAIAYEKSKKQQLFITGIGILLILVLSFSAFVYRSFLQKKRSNIEISRQKGIIEEKQKEILDSIHYAKRIQTALLAQKEFIDKHIPENFLFFKPKDIVSGDFYWATTFNGKFYLAVCDSTGHGVPGAFMSLLNMGFLSEAIKEKNISKPNEVFDYVRKRLIETISNEGQKDGMDGILVCMDSVSGEITYAAAHNKPVFISEKQCHILEADKMPVGKGENSQSFKLYTINAKSRGTLYLYTDGFADQFGGPKGKKFKYKNLDELLTKIESLPIDQRQDKLSEAFLNWKGDLEQIDDVLLFGIKV